MLGTQRTILEPYFFAMARWGENFLDISENYPDVARHLDMMWTDSVDDTTVEDFELSWRINTLGLLVATRRPSRYWTICAAKAVERYS